MSIFKKTTLSILNHNATYGEVVAYISDEDARIVHVELTELTRKETMGYTYMDMMNFI